MTFVRVAGPDEAGRLQSAAAYVFSVPLVQTYLPQLQSKLTHIEVRYFHAPRFQSAEAAGVVAAADGTKFGLIRINTARAAVLEVSHSPDNLAEQPSTVRRQLTLEEVIGHGLGHIIEADGQPFSLSQSLTNDESKAVELEATVGEALGLLTSRGYRTGVRDTGAGDDEWRSRIYFEDVGEVVDGKLVKLINQFELNQGINQRPPRCFVAGTMIDMADGSRKPIEDVAVGDMVMSFDPRAAQGLGPAQAKRVSRTFRNTARVLIDVAGLRVTPGHEMLSDGGEWMSVAEVLRRDRCLIRDVEGPDGLRRSVPFRARTGQRLGGLYDIVFATRYRDRETGAARLADVRGGIPFALTGFQGGGGRMETALLPLYQTAHLDGLLDPARSLAAGAPRDAAGRPLPVIDWPESRTPFNRPGGENFIVAVDRRAHVPGWVAAIARCHEDTRAAITEGRGADELLLFEMREMKEFLAENNSRSKHSARVLVALQFVIGRHSQ